ncbi:MAG: BMP family ABC transporter substrate-binding protein [Bacillus subtilis]|nr:BMP family ABC transporter substrate-binding protein [Bacillus subtilis]
MVLAEGEEYEIAMITDSGTIDDESFNQGTWEGIVEFCDANSLTYKYYKPLEVSDAAYLAAIQLAVQGGAKVIVTPGFLFESSVYAAQTQFPTVKFILIDGTPHTPDYATFFTASNTMNILFNEHESGFLAGYAAVMDGYRKLGFIGGMAVPAVVKFGIGFVAGAFYAAEELNVRITFKNANYVYLGDFAPSDEHKNLASSWYVSGTEIIFAAAGGAGSSVYAAAADNDAMMIGVDIDQSQQSTTVLTSAMKMLGVAVQQGLQAYIDDEFPGGTTVYKGAANDGVGLPMATSRFENFTVTQYNTIYAKLANGTVVVPADYDSLLTFLDGVNGLPDRWAIEGTEAPANNTGLIVGIVVGAAALIGGAIFFVLKKK